MTAEKILENELNNVGFSFAKQLKPNNISFADVRKVKKAIKNAMEEYAKQRMINFMDWLFEQPHEYVTFHTSKELVDDYLDKRNESTL